MADSMDPFARFEGQMWREAAASVEKVVASEWQSAQASIKQNGDLPGQLTSAIAKLDPDLRTIAARFATIAGRGNLDPTALLDAYLSEPNTTTLTALGEQMLAVSGGETNTTERVLRQQLLTQLPTVLEDSATTTVDVDKDVWLETLFLAMDSSAEEPADEWLASAKVYFEQRVALFKNETPKWAAMKGVQRKERFESELSSRESVVYASSDYLRSSVGVALTPAPAERPTPQRVPTWAIVTGGVVLLLLIAGIGFVTGVIPSPWETPEATAGVAETAEEDATADANEAGEATNAQPTEVVAEEETPEPTPEPQGQLQTGQGWLCAAGTEWRQLMTVANVGEVATTYTVTGLTDGQLGGQVFALPASPGDCSPTGEQAPEIAVDPQTASELLLVFPIPPEGASDLKAELRVAGGEAALSTLDLPAPQALAVSLTRPDNAPDTYVWQEGQPVEASFLLQANSPGDYELVCIHENGELQTEPMLVQVIATDEPVETVCIINTACNNDAAYFTEKYWSGNPDQVSCEADNWRSLVYIPSPEGEMPVEVALDEGAVSEFAVEPVSYELDAQPGMHLGVRWIDAVANNNNKVAIVQVYELRNLGNEPYEIEGIATYESGDSSGDNWGVIDIRYITLLDGSAPLTGTMSIVDEEQSAITLRDEEGEDHRFESLPFTTDTAITRVDLPKLPHCPVGELDGIGEEPGPCTLQLAVWFNTWDLGSISEDQPVIYRMQFRPLPNRDDRELVAAIEPLETRITTGILESENPELVIEQD